LFLSDREVVMRSIFRILVALALALAIPLFSAGVASARPPDVFEEAVRTDVNLCNGEVVPLVGVFRVVTNEHKDGSFVQVSTYHATGVGSQGNEYVLNISSVNKAGVGQVQRELLVSKGSAPNQLLVITLPASGGIIIEADCRG
jgi:hypothetical protein